MSQPLNNVAHLPLTFPDLGANDKPLNTRANLAALLRSRAWEPAFNLLTGEYEVLDDGKMLGRSLEGQLSELISACSTAGLTKTALDEHLPALARDNAYHPVVRWLEDGAAWDGKKRIAQVITTLNAVDPNYAQGVLETFFVSAIAALYEREHGRTFQTKLVPILQGEQSAKKSAWLSRIFSVYEDSFQSCALNPSSRDSVKSSLSAWVNELGEIETTTRHEAGALKDYLTRGKDRYRAPFGRTDIIKLRQTVFIGTVNGSDFLKDTTGNTRFAVVELTKGTPINIEKLNGLLGWKYNNGRQTLVKPELLRQFWLEVKSLYDDGASWHLDKQTLATAAETNSRNTDKGPYYQFLFETHLDKNFDEYMWLSSAEVAGFSGYDKAKTSVIGRALNMLHEEGEIEMRTKSGRRREYLLPLSTQDARTCMVNYKKQTSNPTAETLKS